MCMCVILCFLSVYSFSTLKVLHRTIESYCSIVSTDNESLEPDSAYYYSLPLAHVTLVLSVLYVNVML